MDTDEHGSKQFAPYMVEMVIIHDPKPPVHHYVHVSINGGAYLIELHKEYPPTITSSLGFYGQHWIISKTRENEAITQCVVTTPGGWITRYILSTQMARKLQNDIAVYEAQQQSIPKPANQSLNTNQHFISQVLLRRFSTNGRIQKYTLKYGKWSSRGTAPQSVFSDYGYNQLLAFGESNNELEERLKPLEDTLPETLAVLDDAAKVKETPLDPEIYKRMCSYCAFLWQMSPFCKLAAPVHFIQQLMFDLSAKNIDFLDALGYRDEDIARIIQHHANGGKFIITGKNYRQLAYRLQFPKQLASLYNVYRYSTKWTVARSPIELPIGDMALIKYHLPNVNVMQSILPISPTSILIGESPMGTNIKTSTDTIVHGGKLEQAGAEYIRSVICQGAVLIVASNTRIGDINEWRKKTVVNLVQLQNVEEVLKSGQMPIMSPQDFLITPASTQDYVKWTHSFLKPYSKEII
jgi:hypothetical protein